MPTPSLAKAKDALLGANGLPGARIAFENVSFRYSDGAECVLEGVSFTCEPGKTTAIIGSTGSVKSTVLKLAERFHDVTSGRITVDGVDVRDVSQHALRAQLGYVPQAAFLFSGTIASNVGYGVDDADEDRIRAAADVAQASDFIAERPEGLATPISQGGTNVSGGQRQRLAIARALATDARAYLFDDSFSALDYKTDAALRHELSSRLGGKTVVIVAQRISTVLNANQIVVLDDGRIVGAGTHEQLMESCQEYREIAMSQLSEEELKGGDGDAEQRSEEDAAPPTHGPGARMMPGEKAKDFKGSIGKLVRFMGQFKAALVLAIIFAIGSAAFNIVGPKVLSKATTELFEGLLAKVGGTGGIDFDAIAGIIAATLVLYLVSAACSFVQGWMMTSVSQRTCYGLRRAIAEKIDRMPVGYFERNSTGDTLSRITNDVDTLGQSLNQGVTQLITSATTIVGVVIMMLTINPLLTGITVLILPVSLALIFTVVKASQKHFRAQQAMLGAINGQVEETFSGHAIVRAFNREQTVAETFGKTNAKLYESAWKSQFLSGVMQPIMNFVGNLGYVGVALAGSVLAVQGVITVGDIQAFIQYVKNFTQPITQLSQVGNVLQQMAAAAERIFAFLEGQAEARSPRLALRRGLRRGVRSRALATILISPSSATSPLRCARVRPWRWWAPPARARPPWSSCSCASTMLTRAPSACAAPTSASSRVPTCATSSAWCCRTRGCSTARCATISPTASSTPPTPRWRQRRVRRTCTISSPRCRMATTR